MVQRKGPDIACPATGPGRKKKNILPPKPESHHPSQDQDMVKRKLKRAISIKKVAELDGLQSHFSHQQLQLHQQKHQPTKPASPNYMKPTTSSGARGITRDSPPTGNSGKHSYPSSRCDSNSITSRPPSPASGGRKPAKILVRRSSLKPVRPVTRRSQENLLLFPEVSTSKATCSSTMKDCKFPSELELTPGSTEAHGTSVLEVCPFTYCSLNGHWHRPLPPLRSFVSARRRLLKAQKSIRLKRLSSCRKKATRKNQKQADEEFPLTGKPDDDDDFFVEIYADSYRDSAGSVADPSNYEDDEEEEEEDYHEDLNVADRFNCYNEEEEEDDVDSEIFSELLQGCSDRIADSYGDCHSEMSCNYDPEQSDDERLSISEMEILERFLDYLEDQENRVKSREGDHCSSPRDNGVFLELNLSDVGEDLDDTEAYESLLRAIEMPGYSANGNEGCEGLYDQTDAVVPMIGNKTRNDLESDLADQCSETFVPGSPSESDGQNSVNEILFSLALLGLEELRNNEAIQGIGLESDGGDTGDEPKRSFSLEESEFLAQFLSEAHQKITAHDARREEPDPDEEIASSVEEQSEDESALGRSHAREELEIAIASHSEDSANSLREGSDMSAISNHQIQNLCDGLEDDQTRSETEDNPEVEGRSRDESEDSVFGLSEDPDNNSGVESEAGNVTDADGDDQILLETEEDLESKSNIAEFTPEESEIAVVDLPENSADISGEESAFSSEKQSEMSETDTNAIRDFSRSRGNQQNPLPIEENLKLKLKITRKNIEEDSEEDLLKAFHPRSPNFLPVEPDPEAEKVDLRHQEIDERRNSEEWMIDHALQEIVSKLAPARKKKVALIVEAIETVVPTSPMLSPVRNENYAFAHAKSVQACS